MNKVFLTGIVRKIGQVNYTGEKVPVLNVTLVTKKYWTDKNGDKKNKSTWHNLVFWGTSADFVFEKLKNGDKLSIIGEIDVQKWTSNEDGEEFINTRTVVSVQEFEIGMGAQ